jgi:hypothetical protein
MTEKFFGSVFGQLEYSNENISAFIQGSASEQGYKRIDNWLKDGVIQQGQAVTQKQTRSFFLGLMQRQVLIIILMNSTMYLQILAIMRNNHYSTLFITLLLQQLQAMIL